MNLNRRKYLQQFGEVCTIVSYDALNYFIGHYSKRQTKLEERGSKKNDMNLYFESSRISTTELFCENS